jgi:hemolysin activation/secretion protein
MALGAVILHGAGALAAQAPDAGQTLRELQQHPIQQRPEKAPDVQTREPAAADTSSAQRFLVTRIRITGAAVIATAELHALVADLEGKTCSLADLDAGARRITQYYRSRGYSVARAYVPAQEVKQGLVTLAVLEGRIGERRLVNESRLSDANAAAHVGVIEPGTVVRDDSIDRMLLLLNDTPGVGGSRATLQPGASVGTSDLLVTLAPGPAYSGTVSVDTYGNRYTGTNRASATLRLNSPLHLGDQIIASGLTSNEHLDYGRLAYQVPLGAQGLHLGAAYADTRYRLGKEFSPLGAHGVATSRSAYAIYPFVRSVRGNVYGTFTRERKSLSDAVDATAAIDDKRVEVNNFGLAGSFQDNLARGGLSTFELSLVAGRLDIRSDVARAIDQLSAQTEGAYTRAYGSVSRLQRITDSMALSVAFSGQVANKNLDSSEKFALGGAYGVRAYPQGEGLGDSGYLTSVELRRDLGQKIQGLLFYDSGFVSISRYPFSSTQNIRYLSGVGAGLNATVLGLRVNSSLAWRTTGDPLSIPSSATQRPLFLLQAGTSF